MATIKPMPIRTQWTLGPTLRFAAIFARSGNASALPLVGGVID